MSITNFEDLRAFVLDDDAERRLLDEQNECTFCWVTADGSPMAVIMAFLFRDGRFWLSSSTQRKRVRALGRDPRVAVVVSSAGCEIGPFKTVTYKGIASLREDDATKTWFYDAIARQSVGTHGEEAVQEYIRKLDSPNRVVIEVAPGLRVSFDGNKKFAASSDPRRPG